MADNLSDVAGKGLSINIKGKEYKLEVLTIDDLAEFESYVRSERLKQFLAAASGMNGDEKAKAVGEIMSKGLTNEELTKEMGTVSGVRFFLWKSLRKTDPDIKLEEMGKLVDLDNMEEITNVLNKMGGEVVKNPKRRRASK